ncbi:sugar ABC transporter permease [Microbacterium sp. AISO3]|jgi:multiple sugar transport system permease protein|uniref:Multiple sugar transport system permease protein n=2 Tax=Microbacterium TaxID=33882 RepID=A0ABU1I3T4_9MICO|nr:MULTISPECIES: sugar ABC transporter permease [Microbacterium]APF34143.1 ABC transporter permease [Microbacterium paludicola]MDR6168545.1 multiple sugar transport system permease protein [Microbacterium paludicola]OAZ40636.1 ABC transporter permease [Microbacterium arborescens]OWP20855.1 sugar ABC transporter permease [Microbacterium sp. AISO3]QCR39478.1 sugar ABC transporter permease [Microbacterium sp. SGAir0570]
MSAIGELSRLRRPAGRAAREKPRDTKAAMVFLAPWLLGLVLVTVLPIAASLYLSFTKYDLFNAPEFIGIDNYVRMAQDPRLAASLGVTFVYVLVGVPLAMGAALGIALLLDKGLRGLAFYRSMFYLPSLLGSSVAVAILWKQIFGVDGLVNQFLAIFGIEGPGWISNPDTALSTIILLSVWGFGAPMVIFLAGLRQIPVMYYEAAAMDGAGSVRQFFSITLPLLSPIVFFNLVLSMIGAFQAFTQAFIISNGSGGPSDSTLFYTLYLYQKGFTAFDMGYASAMAWLLVAIIAGFTAVNFALSKLWVFYDD